MELHRTYLRTDAIYSYRPQTNDYVFLVTCGRTNIRGSWTKVFQINENPVNLIEYAATVAQRIELGA